MYQPSYAWLQQRIEGEVRSRFVATVIYMRTDEPEQVIRSFQRHGPGVYDRTPLFWYRAEPMDLSLLKPTANRANADAGTIGCFLSHVCVAHNIATWLHKQPPPHPSDQPTYFLVLEADVVIEPYIANITAELDRLYAALQGDLQNKDPAWTVVKLSHWGSPKLDRNTWTITADSSSPDSLFLKTYSGVDMFGGTQAYLLNPANLQRYLDAMLPTGSDSPKMGSFNIPFHVDSLINEHSTSYLYRKPLFGHGDSFHTREATSKMSASQLDSAVRPLHNLSSLFNFYCNNDLANKMNALL